MYSYLKNLGFFFFLLGIVPLYAQQSVVVNIPSYQLSLYENNTRLFQAFCSVGKSSSPTQIGSGMITEKSIFSDQEKMSDHVLEKSHEGVKVLFTEMDGRKNNTIRPLASGWDLQTASSDGSIGLSSQEMFTLYQKVSSPLPQLQVTYQTLFYDSSSQEVLVYLDLYGLGTNTGEKFFEILENRQISTDYLDKKRIGENLRLIDSRLKAKEYKERVMGSRGKNLKQEKDVFLWKGKIKELMSPIKEVKEVISSQIFPSSCIYTSLLKQKFSPGEAVKISKRLEKEFDVKGVKPGDFYEIEVQEGLVMKFTLFQRKGSKEVFLGDLSIDFGADRQLHEVKELS